ncbi:MAG: aspartyl-tRNA(Asn)/glutamyl-tRNA(Gln) amidotransferase subunit [Mycobacterium sp.]|nr:aspartyl-tRNA(Asn)/glutamyl-tRNA(Gln) amidotransferase subunit [Mycobacterium sp.]MDT5247958.1 aspartyl-tRNA(Asn)/glutamyl-tRNA(Gln) amidotransferase subunit [Mycobacterium sp.]MDT5402369.1 aspartyl-tRNA(Asn)/glutamyl-tRNA(Gln) amidotransferase subunit [Mycobacterium sp.]
MTSTRSRCSTRAGKADVELCSAARVRERLRVGELTSVELTESLLRRIKETEPLVHAYAHVCAESAMRSALAADERRAAGEDLPLLGIPLAIKDNIETVDAPTEVGSRVMRGHRPLRDANVVERLRAAGAVILGKTVTHEFAYGLNTPPTRNPWDLDRFPGASSAGSAVAVAVGSAFGALGTDTAGSVRTPAAVNGIVGFKPTYGRISRAGVFPASPSLDHVGMLARTVEDCTLLFEAICDPGPSRPAADTTVDLRGVRLGVERPYFFDYPEVQDGIRDAAEQAIEVLSSLGAEVVEVSVPELGFASAAGSIINLVENSAWHQRLLHTHYCDYEPETRRMLSLGSLIPAAAYVNAQKARRVIVDALHRTYREHGLTALVGPTIPTVAHVLTDPPLSPTPRLSPLVHHNYPANLAGLPALSVPCGFSDDLPVGLHITGRPFGDDNVMRVGLAYQRATRWSSCFPPLDVGEVS